MKEFFGLVEDTRPVEGFMSWQHLTFVSVAMVIMISFAVFFGIRNRKCGEKRKNRVLIIAAILINFFEIFKIVFLTIRDNDPEVILYNLPLFLCSIQLITIPLSAFTRGRVREASLDFVLIFGILGAILGTYCAGNNYGSYPVISFVNVISTITHCISGFCSIYIAVSGMTSMKKKNIPITFGIMAAFCIMAYIVNIVVDYNYMFLMRGDGTPYDILYNLLGGNAVLYPLSVVLLFVVYIVAFYFAHHLITNHKRKS